MLDQASTLCELLASAGITSLFNTRLQLSMSERKEIFREKIKEIIRKKDLGGRGGGLKSRENR